MGLCPPFDFVSARLVIDPPGMRVPKLQVDSDTIALQVWGEQNVKICRPIAGLPVTAKRPEPFLTPLMRPGDALFVPSGLEVRFEGPPPSVRGDEPTLYVVFSVRTNEQSFGTSLGKHLSDVLWETRFSKQADALFRSAVTKRTLGPSGSDDSAEAIAERRSNLDSGLKAAVAELRQRVNAESLQKHVAKRMDQLRKEQAEGAAKAAAQRLPNESQFVTNRSFIRVATDVVCEFQPGDPRALFTRGSETLPLPIAQTASYMIAELCDGAPHRLTSLTCSDPLERICVAQVLVFKECLETSKPAC